jgi:hypothetical protein
LRRADELEELIDGLEALDDAGRIERLCGPGDAGAVQRGRAAARG